jgi:poly(A) polymerase
LSSFLADEPESGGLTWRVLSTVDQWVRERKETPSEVVLWFLLLAEPLLEACSGTRDRMAAAGRFLEPIIDRLNLPRRVADSMRRVAAVFPRLESGRIGRLNRSALWTELRQIVEIRRVAQGLPEDPGDMLDASPRPAKPPRRATQRPRAET